MGDYAGLERIEEQMNETLRTLLERRSIRAYTPDPIRDEHIGILLEALRAAPNAGNLQSVHAILIRDPKRKQRIARAAYHQDWITEAPVILILTSNTRILTEKYGEQGGSYAIQDAAIAGMSILIAAASLGLGSCYVSAFDEAQIREICQIPDEEKPVAIITLGRPRGMPDKPPRKPPETFISYEAYGRRPPSSILKGSLQLRKIIQEEAERFLPPLHEKLHQTIGRLELGMLRQALEARAEEIAQLKEELVKLQLSLKEAEAARRLAERKAAWKTGPWSYHVLKAVKHQQPPYTRQQLKRILQDISFKGYRIDSLLPHLPPRITSRKDLLHQLKEAIRRKEEEGGRG